jgi:4-diphosphocytidyl-2-C-methyl-D-erythritol kinase
MEGSVTVRCPAKINPVLRVLARRPDGYHELDLELQSLALSDELRIGRARALTLEVTGAPAGEVPVDDNLVLRAARALQAAVGAERLPGAAFRLRKRVPAAAGLGGGSSDAAGALEGLDRLFGLGVERALLARLALSLGSDVPYFLEGGRRRGRGRGERLEALPEGPDRPILLLRPRVALSTRAVFERHAARRAGMLTSRKPRASFASESRSGEAPVGLANDLWDAASELEPCLLGWRRRLEARWAPDRVGLSGSGPTLFALGASDDDGAALRRLASELADADAQVILTRTLGHAEYRATRFERTGGPAGGEDPGG